MGIISDLVYKAYCYQNGIREDENKEMTNEKAIALLEEVFEFYTSMYGMYADSEAYNKAFDMAIKALKAQDKGPDQWCTDCKEYDAEHHNCPRFNRVIRSALQDSKQDTVSRQAVLDAIFVKPAWHSSDGSYYHSDDIRDAVMQLPSAEPERWNRMMMYLADLQLTYSTGWGSSKCGDEKLYEFVTGLIEEFEGWEENAD